MDQIKGKHSEWIGELKRLEEIAQRNKIAAKT